MLNIRALRNKKNITQAALAEKMGVSQGVISQWESGAAFPSSAKLPRIAEILGCTVSDLFGADGKRAYVALDELHCANEKG